MAPDAFDILGLSPSFDLQSADIEGAYLALVAGSHPDLADTQDAAISRSAAELNDARRDLLDPERRARLLLKRLEMDAEPGDRDGLPDGFLMEIMESRMELEAAASSGDARRVARWRDWAQAERARYIERLSAMFAGAPSDRSLVAEIRCEINAWRYVERLIEQLPAL